MVAALRAALAVLAVLALAAGCGIDPESSANRARPDDVPFGLLEEPEASADPSTGDDVSIHLVAEGQLVEVGRSLPPDAGLDRLLEVLAAGPTPAEQDLGLSSSLPEGEVQDVQVGRGVAEVDLAPTFADLDGRDQALAIAQIVHTITGRPGIGRVLFTLDGARAEVPRGDGTLTTEPLARDDFDDVAPEP